MRIFYAADKTPCPLIESLMWRNNLYLSLIELGHDVVEFDYNFKETFSNLDKRDPMQKLFIIKNKPKMTAELLQQLEKAHSYQPIDLFFSHLYDACISTEAIDHISSMGIKTVNLYFKDSYQLHLASEISPHYDWCLVPKKSHLKQFKKIGANPVYFQQAANPKICRTYDIPYEHDVSFIGQGYGERPAIVKYLLDNGVDVKVWGAGWQDYVTDGTKLNVCYDTVDIVNDLFVSEYLNKTTKLHQYMIGKPLSDLEMIKTYSRSKINLGFSSCDESYKTDNRILQIRSRDFEVPMSGGFYMVEYMKELEEFYDIGKEIVCYTDPDDLLKKIAYYLKHDDKREIIRAAGYKRCKRDHTWYKRLKTAFEQMELE